MLTGDGFTDQVNTDQASVKYRTTWISIIIVMVFTVVAAVFLGVMLALENRRRDREAGIAPAQPATVAPGVASEKEQEQEHDAEKHAYLADDSDSSVEGLMHVDRDLTDWEDRTFRYAL